MSRWVIAAGLKLIVVPIDSTWMRRSLASGSRARASHASRARAGRSRQRQSKWAGSTRRCTRTALVTAPFSIWAPLGCHRALPHLGWDRPNRPANAENKRPNGRSNYRGSVDRSELVWSTSVGGSLFRTASGPPRLGSSHSDEKPGNPAGPSSLNIER
jgi:hypothetical protein